MLILDTRTDIEPGLYTKDALDQAVEASATQRRPERFVLDNTTNDLPTVIVVNSPLMTERASVDELRAMAQEQVQHYLASEKHLSWPDRQKAINEAFALHLENRTRAKREALARGLKGFYIQ